MLLDLWNEYLYRPLFNFLIWMYNNWTEGNLGWAIVYLTIGLRLVLLPFTIVSERNKIKNQAIIDELKRVQKGYHKDPVLQKQEIRRVLKQRKVRPWSSVWVLAAQGLVLVLLYQVFLQGLTGEKVKILRLLYNFVDFPGAINTNFYGFDLGATHDWIWPGMVAVFLWIYIYYEYKKYKVKITSGDFTYFLLFPIGSFVVLWALPMVKSLFILTSLVFSVIIHFILRIFIRPAKPS